MNSVNMSKTKERSYKAAQAAGPVCKWVHYRGGLCPRQGHGRSRTLCNALKLMHCNKRANPPEALSMIDGAAVQTDPASAFLQIAS